MAVVLRAASLLLAYEGELNTSSNPVPRLVEFQSLSKLTAALSTRKWKLTKGTSAATALIFAQEPVLQSSGAQGLAAPPFDELAWWPETTNTTNNMRPAVYSCCFLKSCCAL